MRLSSVVSQLLGFEVKQVNDVFWHFSGHIWVSPGSSLDMSFSVDVGTSSESLDCGVPQSSDLRPVKNLKAANFLQLL